MKFKVLFFLLLIALPCFAQKQKKTKKGIANYSVSAQLMPIVESEGFSFETVNDTSNFSNPSFIFGRKINIRGYKKISNRFELSAGLEYSSRKVYWRTSGNFGLSRYSGKVRNIWETKYQGLSIGAVWHCKGKSNPNLPVLALTTGWQFGALIHHSVDNKMYYNSFLMKELPLAPEPQFSKAYINTYYGIRFAVIRKGNIYFTIEPRFLTSINRTYKDLDSDPSEGFGLAYQLAFDLNIPKKNKK